MRKVTRIFGLILVPALLATAYLATASASPATDRDQQPLQVYGDRSWPLERGIAYWNDRAGHEVLHYAGSRLSLAGANDPHTVVVMIDELTDGSGETLGIPGRTPQAITIDGRAMFEWKIYARELGQALDFGRATRP